MKTDKQIVDDCNRLARIFYGQMGYEAPERFRFDASLHPQERGCWNMAAAAYYFIEGTDAEFALGKEEDEHA